MTSRVLRAGATLVALVVFGVLLYVASRRIDIARVSQELAHIRLAWVLAAIVSYASILPLWALQWRILAPPTPRNTFREMLGVCAIASTTHNTTVAFVGEATSVVLLTARAGLTRPEGLSVIAMDQLIVGLAKVGVLLAAALMLSLPDWMNAGIATLAIGVVVLLTTTLLGAWHYEVIASRAERVLPQRAARALHGMGVALSPLRSPTRAGAALALAFAKKLAEVLAILCLQHAFGIHLPFASAVLILAATNMATIIPLVPANLGVYEAAITLIYVRFGIPMDLAVGAAVVQHATYFIALALPGYGWLSTTGMSTRPAAAS